MVYPKAPSNLFVNNFGNISVIVWDKVIKDLDQNFTNVIAYYVYRTVNPAVDSTSDWQLLKIVESLDNFGDVDTFCIDFAPNNYIYIVCAANVEGTGPCASSYGIVSVVNQNVFPKIALWDVALWDIDVWG